MAEERLIDDDKDRKYRLRRNENGDEELVLIDADEETGDVLPIYSVITDEDDGFTEEERVEKNELRQQTIARKAEELKAAARKMLAAGDFDGATGALSQASEITEYDGELYFLRLKALSRGLTDFTDLQGCVDAADGVREYSGEEHKKELEGMSALLRSEIAARAEECDGLRKENERGKEERRETFRKEKKRAFVRFSCAVAPFAILCIIAVVFASMIYADKNGLYFVLTAVFAAASAVALGAALFTLNGLIGASRKVRLNESDATTQVGREYLESSAELEKLNAIYSSFKNNDIS